MIADRRLDPATAHPLNAADCERSQARLADIELGMSHNSDGWFWRERAQHRIAALEDDSEMFGLAPHEAAELELLKGLLAKPPATFADPKNG